MRDFRVFKVVLNQINRHNSRVFIRSNHFIKDREIERKKEKSTKKIQIQSNKWPDIQNKNKLKSVIDCERVWGYIGQDTKYKWRTHCLSYCYSLISLLCLLCSSIQKRSFAKRNGTCQKGIFATQPYDFSLSRFPIISSFSLF